MLRLATLVVLLTPALAHAQEGAIADARAALRAGDPERAIAILERAQETSTDPEIELELSIAHEQLGHGAEAAAHLEAYLGADPELDRDERRELELHLRDLRSVASRPARGDPTLEIAGWAQLVAGIAGMIVFLGGGVAVLAIENGLPMECRMEERLCAPGARDPIRTGWTVAGIGIGAGIPLAILGAIELVIAGNSQSGATYALPPDLDPTIHDRPGVFTLAPWATPDGGGLAAAITF